MTRKDVRSHAFKILFQLKFFSVKQVKDKLDLYFTCQDLVIEEPVRPEYQEKEEAEKFDEELKKTLKEISKLEESKKQILDFVNGVTDHLTEIDDVLSKYMKGWKTTRIPSADLAILRMAVYEMLYSDLSIKIIANEAVELAKNYSTDESPSFVNAIIGQIHKSL